METNDFDPYIFGTWSLSDKEVASARDVALTTRSQWKGCSDDNSGGKATMLFYTSIFVVCLIAAHLVGSFYKAITNKNRSVHTSNKRVAITDSSGRYQKERTGFKTCNGLSVLSAQGSGVVSKTHPAKPAVCHSQDTSWLIREKKISSMNEFYKVRRRVQPEPPTLEVVSKPFSRNADPWEKDNKTAVRPWKM